MDAKCEVCGMELKYHGKICVTGGSMKPLKSWLHRLWLSVMSKHNDEYAQDILEELRRIRHEIQELKGLIISAISDFATAQNAFQDRMDTAVTGLQGDVKNLTDQIAALQNSTGTITPADQALLDGIQARAKSVADKLDALDQLTPPVVPAA